MGDPNYSPRPGGRGESISLSGPDIGREFTRPVDSQCAGPDCISAGARGLYVGIASSQGAIPQIVDPKRAYLSYRIGRPAVRGGWPCRVSEEPASGGREG